MLTVQIFRFSFLGLNGRKYVKMCPIKIFCEKMDFPLRELFWHCKFSEKFGIFDYCFLASNGQNKLKRALLASRRGEQKSKTIILWCPVGKKVICIANKRYFGSSCSIRYLNFVSKGNDMKIWGMNILVKIIYFDHKGSDVWISRWQLWFWIDFT